MPAGARSPQHRRLRAAHWGSHGAETDHGRRHRLGRPRHRSAAPRAPRERRARGAPRRHGHVRALGRAPPLRRVPPRPRRLRPRLRATQSARSSSGRAPTACCPSRRSTSRASPSIATTFPVPVLVSKPDAIFRSNDKAETYAFLHRLGAAGAGVPARQRRGGGRGRRPRARLPGRSRLLQAGVLVGLARLPDPRPDGRPRPPAAQRTARLGRDAPRGGRRAASRRGRPRSARDGARDRRRAHDRRHRRRRARSCSGTRRRARRCAPGSRCTSSRSRTRR